MRFPLRCRPLAVALTLLVVSRAAPAQTTVTVPSNGAILFCAPLAAFDFRCGQLFTVPAVDHVLERFTFTQLGATGAPLFEIWALSGASLDGVPLYSAPVTPTGGQATFASQTFTPAGGLSLTAGVQYAAVLRLRPSPSGDAVGIGSNDTDPYAGGRAVTCPVAMACSPVGATANFDAAFEARFVSAVAAPEPGSVALLATGPTALGALALRRRARG